METNPRDYGEQCRFDAFCKTVLKHEAIDYIREMKRRASRETSLERLPQTAMDKLCSADDYPSDSYVFSYCGYNLPISSERVANAFASLPESRLRGLWDFLYWLRLSAVCLESGRYLQGYSRPEPVGQCLKCCLYLLL